VSEFSGFARSRTSRVSVLFECLPLPDEGGGWRGDDWGGQLRLKMRRQSAPIVLLLSLCLSSFTSLSNESHKIIKDDR
jgi:hypothetical protein